MPLIKLQQYSFKYQMVRLEDIHFIKLYLDDLNGVKITAPTQKPWNKVEAFLMKKEDWILEKWKNIHPDLYENEESNRLPYLGRKYKLLLSADQVDEPLFIFSKGRFIFTYPENYNKVECLAMLNKHREKWLKNKAAEKFALLTEVPVSVEEDYFRLGKKEKDAILLNWRLIHRSKRDISRHIEDLKHEKTF
ncbi:YgjP-like metallopeptidase domain-containing protein [Halobacillus massiliensis]|uniref:YgjP-like metallopeptidase domain-containing protein n=1 Tax=Halobacillus massiliensis TaxID=1926286 RepID=UPI0015C42332|nr:YgjP-like metallopeptidase domain-containing protein [Halobacillus massiliensis]